MNNTRVSRRDFLKLLKVMALPVAAVGLLGYGYSTEVEVNWIEITNLTLKLPRLDPAFQGIRLVQISDFHLGQWIDEEKLDRVIKMTLEQAPDYVLLTGDYLEYRPYGRRNVWDTYEANLKVVSRAFARLSTACPTIAILGNHDHKIYAGWVEVSLLKAGITVLRNSVMTIQRGNTKLHIAGLDDVSEKMDRLDILLKSLPEDGSAILLAHEPDFADTAAATGRFDLQISGHSHGGQIVLPFFGPPILPELARKYPSGLYKINNMLLYTNRGVGVTTVNARFNCRPEITVFTLEAD